MPPLVGIAVNVIAVPGQITVVFALIATDATTLDWTVIVIPVFVAVDGLAQGAFDVNIQVTI